MWPFLPARHAIHLQRDQIFRIHLVCLELESFSWWNKQQAALELLVLLPIKQFTSFQHKLKYFQDIQLTLIFNSFELPWVTMSSLIVPIYLPLNFSVLSIWMSLSPSSHLSCSNGHKSGWVFEMQQLHSIQRWPIHSLLMVCSHMKEGASMSKDKS